LMGATPMLAEMKQALSVTRGGLRMCGGTREPGVLPPARTMSCAGS